MHTALPDSTQAVIFGLHGTQLQATERDFFKEVQPLGYILFKRNCENRQQLRQLTDSLREVSGRDDLLILIDQEGGRVVRLAPPEWGAIPAAATFDALAQNKDMETASRATYLQARIIASQLSDAGITVNCAPLADIPAPGSHDIIGDRAFGKTAVQVTALAHQQAKGLLEGGILPVLKHIPGHGRAMADSHEALPIVDASLETLCATDFKPFQALANLPFGMTAHILYPALDQQLIATQSPTIIDYIRREIGFDGALMTDDLSMKAMKGSMAQRAELSLKAGCDIVLHCNGLMDEMQQVAKGLSPLTSEAIRRIDHAWQQRENARLHHDKVEMVDIRDELASLLA